MNIVFYLLLFGFVALAIILLVMYGVAGNIGEGLNDAYEILRKELYGEEEDDER